LIRIESKKLQFEKHCEQETSGLRPTDDRNSNRQDGSERQQGGHHASMTSADGGRAVSVTLFDARDLIRTMIE
jgi:hypothetical protein